MPPKTATWQNRQNDEEWEDGEGDPLLRKEKEEMNLTKLGIHTGWNGHYNPSHLASFRTFTYLSGTVFFNRGIWMVCGVLVILAFSIAMVTVTLLPGTHDLGKFETIVKYIKVFIAFMLGMFMNNSLQRWWQTVNTLTDYFCNIEKLIFCVNSFGVQHYGNARDELVRLSVLSCEMLRAEVLCLWSPPEDARREWTRTFDQMEDEGLLTSIEREALCQVRPADRSVSPWSWISDLLFELFETQGLKPAAMNRMVVQCQIAVHLASQLRIQVSVQMPFMYAHMMSLLVYMNNFLVAVMCGMSLGASLGQMSHAHSSKNYDNMVSGAQEMGVSLLTLFIEPMLYQAFLQIGTNFCYPFGRTHDHVPVHRMITDLRVNINQMNFLIDNRNAGGGTKLRLIPAYTPREREVATNCEDPEDGGDDV